MASPRTRSKRVVRSLRVVYSQVGQLSEKVSSVPEVSCTRGCDHCCYQAIAMTIPEGIVLLDASPDGWWDEHGDEAERRASLWVDKKVSRKSWMASKTPCLFLKDHECSAYRSRPFACATYAVTSDPKWCSPDRPGSTVGVIDMRDLAVEAAEKSMDVAMGSGIPPAVMPMSVALVLARAFMVGGSEAIFAKLQEWNLPTHPREVFVAFHDIMYPEES